MVEKNPLPSKGSNKYLLNKVLKKGQCVKMVETGYMKGSWELQQ